MATAPTSVQELARSMAYKSLRKIGAELQNVMLDLADTTASTTSATSTPAAVAIANEIGSIEPTDASGVLVLRLAARVIAPTPEVKDALLDILDCAYRLHIHQPEEFVDRSGVIRIKDRVAELQTLCSLPKHRLEGLQDAFSVVVLSLECVRRDVSDE